MIERFEKMKRHIKENRKVYITGGICLITGAALGVLMAKRPGMTEEYIASIKAQVSAANKNQVLCRNYTFQRVSIYGNPIGHPGNPVRCVETGKEFASQSLAAAWAGANSCNMTKHLAGRQEHLNGYTFERA